MPFATVLLIFLGLWQTLHLASGSKDVPAPGQTVLRLCQMLGSAYFWGDIGATFIAFAASLVISIGAGLGFGVVLGLRRQAGALIEPLLSNFFAIPKVTLYPIVLAFFGLGLAPKIAFGVMHAIVPVILLTKRAVEQIKPAHLRTARSLRLRVSDIVVRVVLPAILPELVAAMRVGASLCLLGVLIGEMFAAKQGLGFAAMSAMGLGDTTSIAAIGLFLVVFAVAINTAMLSLERKTTAGMSTN
jgi:NitT/TauT family transport system permease protein